MPLINISDAFETPPPAQDFVLPGYLTGTVGALVAPGSTGKSFWALQAAAAVASSDPLADTLGLGLKRHGEVLYINLEDPKDELNRRIYALGSRWSSETRASVIENLHVSARHGISTDIMGDKFTTALLKFGSGKRLVVIDTLSRAHKLDENDNGAMSQVVGRLEMVAQRTGAAVLYLHHTSKAAALAGQGGMQQSARGASALIDNARWGGNLMKMTEDEGKFFSDSGKIIGEDHILYVRFVVGKQNYGTAEGARWLKRTEGGILSPVELHGSKGQLKRRYGDI